MAEIKKEPVPHEDLLELAQSFNLPYEQVKHTLVNATEPALKKEKTDTNETLLLAEMVLIATGMEANKDMVEVVQNDRKRQAPVIINPKVKDALLNKVFRTDTSEFRERREQILIAMHTRFADLLKQNVIDNQSAKYGHLEQVITGMYRTLTILNLEHSSSEQQIKKSPLEQDIFNLRPALEGLKSRFYSAVEGDPNSKPGDLNQQQNELVISSEKSRLDQLFIIPLIKKANKNGALRSYQKYANQLNWDLTADKQSRANRAHDAVDSLIAYAAVHGQPKQAETQLTESAQNPRMTETSTQSENSYASLSESDLNLHMLAMLKRIEEAKKNNQIIVGKEATDFRNLFRAYQNLLAHKAQSGQYNKEYVGVINGLVNALTARGVEL